MLQATGQKGILAMGGGEVPGSRALLCPADPQHPGLTSSGGFPPLCTTVPGNPILVPNNQIQLLHLC